MSLHPQVASLLERVARSPLPPELAEVRLLATENFALRDTANAAVAECCAALRGAFQKVPA